MNTLLDSIFLRRPRIEYISPAICEALFSASGTVNIFLSEFEKHKAPTGGVLGGIGRIFFRWTNYPGELCHNVYRAVTSDPNGPYSLVSECIPPGVVAVCSLGDYTITIVTTDGESGPGPVTHCDGLGYAFIPLPQNPNARCFNLYRNGVLVFDCFQGGAFEICEPGCYRTSAITNDGETSLSTPVCTPDCSAVTCPPGHIANPSDCTCIVCPVQTCADGFHWDATQCECVMNPTPPPPCTAFIDETPNLYGFFPHAALKGGFMFATDGGSFLPEFYHTRVFSAPFSAQAAFTYATNAQGKAALSELSTGNVIWFDSNTSDYRIAAAGTFQPPVGVDAVGNLVGMDTSGGQQCGSIYDPLSSTYSLLVDPISVGGSGLVAAAGTLQIVLTTVIGDGSVYTRRYRNGLWETLVVTVFGTSTSGALDINDSGTALYNYGPNAGPTTTEINSVANGITSIITDPNYKGQYINNHDWVVLSTTGPSGPSLVFRPGVGLTTIPLLGGVTAALAVAITDSNMVFGSSLDGSQAPWVWTPASGTVALTTLIPIGSGWTVIDQVYNASSTLTDTFALVHGTKNGVPTFGVMKVCIV